MLHSVPSQPAERSVGVPKAVAEAMALKVGCAVAGLGGS